MGKRKRVESEGDSSESGTSAAGNHTANKGNSSNHTATASGDNHQQSGNANSSSKKQSRVEPAYQQPSSSAAANYTNTFRGEIPGIPRKAVEKYDGHIFSQPLLSSYALGSIQAIINEEHRLPYLQARLAGYDFVSAYSSTPKNKIYTLPVEMSEKLRALDEVHKQVFNMIANTDVDGLWTRTLKNESKIATGEVTKIIRKLENQSLIKTRQLNKSRQKIYMLGFLNPPREQTGGIWFDEGKFDSELVTILRDLVFKIIHDADSSGITVSSIREEVIASGLLLTPPDDLKLEDIMQLVDQLAYEGKVRLAGIGPQQLGYYYKTWSSKDPDVRMHKDKYVPMNIIAPLGAQLANFPCGRCSLRDICTEGGFISPLTCQYMEDWIGPVTFDRHKVSSSSEAKQA